MLRPVLLLLATVSTLSAASPFQPLISPNGVVNAASYLSHAFPNYGIARGSIFTVFGLALGPVNLVSATSLPLPTTEGLAGTRVLVAIGAYNAACPMVFTSINQVAAIMPSNAPEGEGTIVVVYQNLASASVPIRVVRNAFGLFTRNQAGSGPAIAQNFVSSTNTPLNTLSSSATPGQTVILWGTGLGPVTGDEISAPLPGALSGLDSLYVGGVQAGVRYAGRSGCCIGVDQVIFDVPAGVSGCYVPVAAVTNGVVSNFGTISVAASGRECDDPLSYRASDILTAERNGSLRVGQISLTSGLPPAETDFSANFYSTDLNALLSDTTRLNPPAGACYVAISRVDAVAARPGAGLNAGESIMVTGPNGQLAAPNTSSGGYFMAKSPSTVGQGNYNFTSAGGSDVGPFTAMLSMGVPATWTNVGAYSTQAVSQNGPLVFTWQGGDAAGYVTIRIASANATYNSVAQCNVASNAATFTIPSQVVRALYPSPVTVSLTSTSAQVPFNASGLDTASITASAATAVQTTLIQTVQ